MADIMIASMSRFQQPRCEMLILDQDSRWFINLFLQDRKQKLRVRKQMKAGMISLHVALFIFWLNYKMPFFHQVENTIGSLPDMLRPFTVDMMVEAFERDGSRYMDLPLPDNWDKAMSGEVTKRILDTIYAPLQYRLDRFWRESNKKDSRARLQYYADNRHTREIVQYQVLYSFTQMAEKFATALGKRQSWRYRLKEQFYDSVDRRWKSITRRCERQAAGRGKTDSSRPV